MENIEALDDETTTYCEAVLKETKTKREDGVKFLRKWLDENKEYHVRRDSYTLVRYLRACKYNQERTLNKLKCMTKLRTDAPEWYKNRDPLLPEIQELMRLGVFLPLLRRDTEGRAVILIRATAHDPHRHLQDNVFKTGLMILDLFLDRFQDTSVHGVVAILDLKDVTFGHARQMTIPIIRKCVHSWQACYPVRIRSINFYNSPVYVNVVLNIFKQFMTPKLKMRVHVHGYDQKSLEKQVSLDILPAEYGGSGDSVEYLTEYWTREVTEARDWYIDDEEFKFIPSKTNG
ncbi:CRAL/TRIO domain [Nesidiocoris tenuis]|uniref:CRAL/TRIO domain n=1 Tax=Nesidiocoris tenuis TaxID=355587 RepID=A0ABN7AVF7_9HEMI|nr:CRAL/TRIO domain [Nesidiocoris tenuis]